MPFRSEKQRRWMWANKPELAAKWESTYGSNPLEPKPKARRKKRKKAT